MRGTAARLSKPIATQTRFDLVCVSGKSRCEKCTQRRIVLDFTLSYGDNLARVSYLLGIAIAGMMRNQSSDDFEEPSEPLPPGPMLSAWDQAKAWIERPIAFWTECQDRFGDTFTVQFGSLGPTVLCCKPEAIRQIFALPGDHYECRTFNDHYRLIMGSKSLLTLDGDEHWDQRRAVAPAFHADKTGDWIATVRAYANGKITKLETSQTIHIRRIVHEVSFNSTLHLLFRDQQLGVRNLLQRLFLELMVSDYGTWSPWARFAKSHSAMRTVLGAEIRRLRGRDSKSFRVGEYESLFNGLVHCQDSQGNRLSETQVEDHVFTMLIAGVDPSAIATTWAIYWIHERPDVLQHLRDELAFVNDVNQYVRREDHFLHAVCLESLRMYPVVTTPSGRRLLKPAEIEGRNYAAGVTLLPCTYLAHRREQLFASPHKFSPERFVDRTYKSWEFFPFGGGRRVCIGARMALHTMKAIIAELLRKLEMKSVTDSAVLPIRHGTLLAPSDNFRLRIAKRLG